MENELRRGYSIPLTTQKWRAWLLLAASVALVAYYEYDMADEGFSLYAVVSIRVLFALLLLPMVLMELARSFAKLHIVPEGLAITLFGKTVRQFPRHQIHLLAGLAYTRKSTTYKWIAVCGHTLEALAQEEDARSHKILRSGKADPEVLARKYLRRYADSLRRQFGLSRKDVLLVEWSPDRLRMLQSMYRTDWVDLSEKKQLDAERGHAPADQVG